MTEKQKKIKLAKRWIAALRSSKYKQGYGYLVSGNKYCCLGVLCDVAKKEFGIIKNISDFTFPKEGNWVGTLPISLTEYLYLDGGVDGRDFKTILMGMNDGKDGKDRKRFSTIANYLEENLLPILESLEN